MSAVVWLVWFIAAVILTAGQLRWQIDFFGHPGPAFRAALLLALPVLLLLVGLWAWVRRAFLWRYELRMLAVLAAATLLFYEPRATLACLWIVVACYAFGHFVKARAGLGEGAPIEDIAISAAIGFATLIVVLFGMGIAGWYYAPVLIGLLALVSVVFWRHVVALATAVRALDAGWRSADELRSPLAGIAIAFSAVFLISSCMVILAPSLAYDVLNMHLPSALFYGRQHVLLPVPDLDYSYYPQGVEALMTAGLMLAGQPLAQMLPPVFFLLTALLLFRIIRICGGSIPGAALGVVCGTSVPFLHWTGSVAKNDMAMTFFELAALYCYLRWRESGRFAWIPAGVFIGSAAFGVKDVVLFGAIPLTLLFLFAAWRQPRRWPALATLVALFLVFGLFWQVRTWIIAPNQVVPSAAAKSIRGAVLGPDPLRKIQRYLHVGWQIQFEGNRSFESPLHVPLGAFLIVFAPLWLMPLRRARDPRVKVSLWRAVVDEISPAERACLLFAFLYLASWALFWGVLRYAIPPILLLCGLTGERIVRLYGRYGWPLRAVVLGACTYVLVFAMTGVMIIELNGPQLLYFAGRLDKAGYLREALQTYRSLEFLGTVVVPGDAVASAGNCSTAYAPGGIRFVAWCGPKDYTATIQRNIGCKPFQYVVLPDHSQGGSPEAVLRQYRNLTRLFDDSNFSVYRLESCPAH